MLSARWVDISGHHRQLSTMQSERLGNDERWDGLTQALTQADVESAIVCAIRFSIGAAKAAVENKRAAVSKGANMTILRVIE